MEIKEFRGTHDSPAWKIFHQIEERGRREKLEEVIRTEAYFLMNNYSSESNGKRKVEASFNLSPVISIKLTLDSSDAEEDPVIMENFRLRYRYDWPDKHGYAVQSGRNSGTAAVEITPDRILNFEGKDATLEDAENIISCLKFMTEQKEIETSQTQIQT